MKKLVFVLIFALLSGCGAKTIQTNADYSQINNKGFGWGIKKIQNSEPEVPDYIKKTLEEYNAVYMGNPSEKKLYLTFDEGYENGYTESILETLKEKNVPATFFITGDYLERSEELVRKMIDEGHIIGNHTKGHKNLHKLSTSDEIAKEISSLDDCFEEKFGYRMKYMRAPEGEYSERVLAVANDMGYRTVFWSFAYKDWIADSRNGADYAVGQIMPYLHNGAVLLLHAVSADNAEALPTVIDRARELGYEFCSLDDIK